MARILILLITLAFSLPVLADKDEDKKRGNSDCAHEANKRDLSGKERKRFMKDCGKHEDRKGDRRREEDRDQHEGRREDRAAPAPVQQQAPSQPSATPSPQPPAAAQAPATPATAPAAPATPAQPAATPAPTPPVTPAVTPQPPKPVLTADQKRQQCESEAKNQRLNLFEKRRFMTACMAR